MDMSGEGQGHLRGEDEVSRSSATANDSDGQRTRLMSLKLMTHWCLTDDWMSLFMFIWHIHTITYIYRCLCLWLFVCVCFQCFSPRVVPLSLIRCLPHFLHVFSRFSFHNSSFLQALGFGLLVWIVPWSIPVLFPMRGWHQMVYKMHSLYFVWSYSYSIKVSSIIFNNWINMNQWYSMISNDLQWYSTIMIFTYVHIFCWYNIPMSSTKTIKNGHNGDVLNHVET